MNNVVYPQGWLMLAAVAGGKKPTDADAFVDLFGGLGWPDAAVVIVLAVGLLLGRRRGMSAELLGVIQWLLIVILGGFFYDTVGQLFMLSGLLNQFYCNVLGYVTIAIALKLIFSSIKRMVGEKMVGANVFGGLEYYLGMMAGMLRFACALFFTLSLLNARLYLPTEVAEMKKYQHDNFGDISFPTMMEVQESVFKYSLTGPLVKSTLSGIMLKPTPITKDNKDSLKARRERDVFDAMKPR
jgi:uncharacterized membrane protein required for colicin V production